MVAVVFPIGTPLSDSKETPDGRREVHFGGTVLQGQLGEKLTNQARDTRVVSAGIAPSPFHHRGIDGDVEPFLGHEISYAHWSALFIRIIDLMFKKWDADVSMEGRALRVNSLLRNLPGWSGRWDV
jgi:hypothetical protein